MNRKRTKAYRMPIERQLLEALTKRFALEPVATFTLLGARHTPEDMLRILAERVAAMEDVDVSQAAWRKAIAAERAKEASTRELFAALRELLHLTYGADPDILVEIGLTPRRRPAALSLEAKTEARTKIEATRRARHTLGKRQRARITGETGETGETADASDAAVEPEVHP